METTPGKLQVLLLHGFQSKSISFIIVNFINAAPTHNKSHLHTTLSSATMSGFYKMNILIAFSDNEAPNRHF